jgi:hypothetical protein
MQNVEYLPKEHFQTFKFWSGNPNEKNLNLGAKWPKINEFEKPFMRFVFPTSIYKKPILSVCAAILDSKYSNSMVSYRYW